MMSSLEQCWRKARGSSFINSQNLELISPPTKLMSSTERNLLFPPFFYPSDVVLGGNGMMLFDGPFLGQLLPVPTIVLSCQRV